VPPVATPGAAAQVAGLVELGALPAATGLSAGLVPPLAAPAAGQAEMPAARASWAVAEWVLLLHSEAVCAGWRLGSHGCCAGCR